MLRALSKFFRPPALLGLVLVAGCLSPGDHQNNAEAYTGRRPKQGRYVWLDDRARCTDQEGHVLRGVRSVISVAPDGGLRLFSDPCSPSSRPLKEEEVDLVSRLSLGDASLSRVMGYGYGIYDFVGEPAGLGAIEVSSTPITHSWCYSPNAYDILIQSVGHTGPLSATVVVTERDAQGRLVAHALPPISVSESAPGSSEREYVGSRFRMRLQVPGLTQTGTASLFINGRDVALTSLTCRAVNGGLAGTPGGGGQAAVCPAGPGQLDPSFNGTGVKRVRFPSGISTNANSVGYDATVDSKGRILVSGAAAAGSAVIRLLDDGQEDVSFADGGYLVGSTPGQAAFTAVEDRSGKVVVARPAAGQTEIGRFLETGVADSAFGTNGKATLAGQIRSLQSFPDGTLIGSHPGGIGGLAENGSVVFNLTTGGKVLPEPILTPDNAIVGALISYQATGARYEMARWSASGVRDTAFGNDGGLVVAGGTPASPFALTPLTGGGFALAGLQSVGASWEHQGYFFRTDGKVDETLPVTHAAAGVSGPASTVSWTPKGPVWAGQGSAPALRRFRPDGTLDTGFAGGTAIVDLGETGLPIVKRVRVQPNGRILITVTFQFIYNNTQYQDIAVLRYCD